MPIFGLRLDQFLHVTRGRFNIKTPSHQNRDSHYKDETVSWPSHLYNGNSYTGKVTSLYGISPQDFCSGYICWVHARTESDSGMWPGFLLWFNLFQGYYISFLCLLSKAPNIIWISSYKCCGQWNRLVFIWSKCFFLTDSIICYYIDIQQISTPLFAADITTRSMYLGHGWLITSHSILWHVITYPCPRY